MSRGYRHRAVAPVAGRTRLVLTLTAAALALTTRGRHREPERRVHRPAWADVRPRSSRNRRSASQAPSSGRSTATTRPRTRNLPLSDPTSLHPPYNVTWRRRRASVLMEFPPVAGRHNLYLLKNDGTVYAITRGTGRLLWKRKIGHLAAASPAYNDNTIYAVLLERTRTARRRIVALNAKNGHMRWSRELPSRAESSPLLRPRPHLLRQRERRPSTALDASDGRVVLDPHGAGRGEGRPGAWTASATSSTAPTGGTVPRRLRAADGGLRWSATGGGNFYSTPAVAYGRVYVGIDRQQGLLVQRRDRRAGLAPRHRRLRLLARRPSAPPPGGGPTVYIGSYDRKLYALDARTGAVRWTRKRGGKDLGRRDGHRRSCTSRPRLEVDLRASARARALVFKRIPRGAYNPVVSDGGASSSTGYASLSGAREAAETRLTRRHAGSRRRPDALCLGDRVGAVVEDRRASTASAPLCSASARCSSSPAPPEAITGTATASATAASARGRSRPSCRRGPCSSAGSPPPRARRPRAPTRPRRGPVGVRPPATYDLPASPSVGALGVDRQHDALRAEHVGQLADQLRAAPPRRS